MIQTFTQENHMHIKQQALRFKCRMYFKDVRERDLTQGEPIIFIRTYSVTPTNKIIAAGDKSNDFINDQDLFGMEFSFDLEDFNEYLNENYVGM